MEGAKLKQFLEDRRTTGRSKLGIGEIYCLSCRAPQIPAGRMVDFQLQSQSKGLLTGLCPVCERVIHRFVSRTDLAAIRSILDVTVQPSLPRLVGDGNAASIVPSKGGRRAYG